MIHKTIFLTLTFLIISPVAGMQSSGRVLARAATSEIARRSYARMSADQMEKLVSLFDSPDFPEALRETQKDQQDLKRLLKTINAHKDSYASEQTILFEENRRIALSKLTKLCKVGVTGWVTTATPICLLKVFDLPFSNEFLSFLAVCVSPPALGISVCATGLAGLWALSAHGLNKRLFISKLIDAQNSDFKIARKNAEYVQKLMNESTKHKTNRKN